MRPRTDMRRPSPPGPRARQLGAAVPDLSPAAVAERKRVGGAGHTAEQLIDAAGGIFREANRAVKVGNQRRPGSRGQRRAHEKADAGLRTAFLQLRIAQDCPDLGRGYMHQLHLSEIQELRRLTNEAFEHDQGALAVAVHRLLQQQRTRLNEWRSHRGR